LRVWAIHPRFPLAGAKRADGRSDLVYAAGTSEPQPGDKRRLIGGIFHHRAEVFRHRAKAGLVDLDQRVRDPLLEALLAPLLDAFLDRFAPLGLDDVLGIHDTLLVVGRLLR